MCAMVTALRLLYADPELSVTSSTLLLLWQLTMGLCVARLYWRHDNILRALDSSAYAKQTRDTG
jgi:hypothetical protein